MRSAESGLGLRPDQFQVQVMADRRSGAGGDRLALPIVDQHTDSVAETVRPCNANLPPRCISPSVLGKNRRSPWPRSPLARFGLDIGFELRSPLRSRISFGRRDRLRAEDAPPRCRNSVQLCINMTYSVWQKHKLDSHTENLLSMEPHSRSRSHSGL